MSIRLLFSLLAFSFSSLLFAQKDDPVLFTVNETPVHLSEFKYIYSKTNGSKGDFSKASLQEYLDLYTNFKLKVQKAKEMRLDTISSLRQELEGYRRQLADSYLIDKEVTEKLVVEAYERTRQDVDLSHILIKVSENAAPADTLSAWNRAMEAKKKIQSGEPFGQVAQTYSDDKSVKTNQGHIGFVTAVFPNSFYALESAAYTGKFEELYGPIRTNAGYHLLVVHGRRPARGEVEVAHILVRLDKSPDPIKARLRMDSIYNQLKAGANFEELAKNHSDDKITAAKGGYLGFFGINRYEKAFEDAAFSLAKDGDFSNPVQTSAGWHILKRISKKDNETLHESRTRLQNKIKEDARFNLARKAMIERIKKEGKFMENRTTLSNFIATLKADTAKTFVTYKWKAPQPASQTLLFSFGNEMKVSLGDFETFAEKSSRKRQQMGASAASVEDIVEQFYQDFVGEQALRFEERQLEAKYPEFKSLMREYEEGVLLFEVTKMEVWDKASQDTAGLQIFYDQHKNKYTWGERAVVNQYFLAEKAQDQLEQVKAFVIANPPTAVLEKFNPMDGEKVLTVIEKTFEKGRNPDLDKLHWQVGTLSNVETIKRDKSLSFMKIEKLLPPGQKSLQEARGYVVADYQDFLEKQWLEKLKKQYKVKVNEKVFNSMVKK